MIELNNVSIVRSGRTLFKELNWKINPGEHWVITGPNGSGKTLLVELLACNITPTVGTISIDFINGTSWEERYTERKKYIHYIPAHALQSLYQSQGTFYQQRYYSIGDERTPKVRDFFGDDLHEIEALQLPGNLSISELLDLDITRLSNGQLKKVLILKNFLSGIPKLLLLDYPFDGLDKDSRNDFCSLLDHFVTAHHVQLVIVDQTYDLPTVINRRFELTNFSIDIVESPASKQQPHVSLQTEIPSPSETAEPIVEMKQVTIRYGTKEIISKLNWVIRKGERWALTGRNGSGKTTLFSLIYADHPMSYSEKVFLFGKRRGSGESIWDIKNRISYLGPELISYLNPKSIYITAKEFILQQKDVSQNAFRHAVDFFDANTLMCKAVNTLSSGELQLMLILITLMKERELVLLDEPFQFLDPALRRRVSEYIQSKLHKDTTLVLITHDQRDIAQWTKQRKQL